MQTAFIPSIQVFKRALIAPELERLYTLIAPDILNELFKQGAYIAGGAAVYALNPNVPALSVGDVDVFVNDPNLFSRCADIVDNLLPLPKHYYRQNSTLKIHAQSRLPIQLVHTPGNIGEIVLSFDFDYVQCAIGVEDGIYVYLTPMCAYAHHTGVVTCILDANWNPSRLVSRLTKAYAKGFHLPQGYDTLTSLGATLYRPKTLNDAEWQRELQRKWQIRMSKSNANKLFSEFESAFEIQVAAKNAKHYDTLKEALESSILPFTPEDYEGEMSYPHAREQEDKILAKPVSYLIVGPKPPLMAPGFRYGNQPKIVEQVPCVLLFD